MDKRFDSYFKKLNIKPQKLSLNLVAQIQKKHIATFSFNNFAVLLNRPISLYIDDIIDKIVIQNLGGYCFEHNKLMHDMLKSLGFKVRFIIGRVVNNQNIDSPRTHRVTLLEFDGDNYLIDVGFGSLCLTTPIKIDSLEVNNQSYRVVKSKNNDYQLEIFKDNVPYVLYNFNLQHYTDADCVVGNFYSSKHQNAVFVNNLVVSLIKEDVTLSLRNDTYHRIYPNHTDIVQIDDSIKLHSIINNEFEILMDREDCKILFEVNK